MRDYEECRPYIAHLLAEHHRLHKIIGQARASIVQSGGPDQDASPSDIVQALTHLRAELAHHFAEEEAGGCLDEAVSRCPRLSPDVKLIETEHTELLREIDLLIAQAKDSQASAADRIALVREFDLLCQQLAAHEAAENNVLREGFGTNFNGENTARSVIHDF